VFSAATWELPATTGRGNLPGHPGRAAGSGTPDLAFDPNSLDALATSTWPCCSGWGCDGERAVPAGDLTGMEPALRGQLQRSLARAPAGILCILSWRVGLTIRPIATAKRSMTQEDTAPVSSGGNNGPARTRTGNPEYESRSAH